MDHKVSKDMISSGMIPSGEKTQADLSRTQYGSAPSPSKLMDAYKSMYDKKDEVINEMKMGDVSGSADFASRNIKGAKGAAPAPKPAPKPETKTEKPKTETDKMLDKVSDRRVEKAVNRDKDVRRARASYIMTKYGESVDLLAAYRSVYEHHKKDADGNTIPHEDEELNEGAGLYANIHAKRKRGGKMRKKGDKGAPSSQDFANAARTAKEEVEQIDELNYDTLSSYVRKASKDKNKDRRKGIGMAKGKQDDKVFGKTKKNKYGYSEEVEVDEAVVSGTLAALKLLGTKAAKLGVKAATKFGGKGAANVVKNVARNPMGAVDNINRVGYAAQTVGNLMPKPGVPAVTKKQSQGGIVSADVDLFDIVKGQLLDEGYSEKEVNEIMVNLTEEQLEEFLKQLATRAAQYGANIGREGSATGFLNQRADKKKVLPVKDQPVKSATDVVKAVSTADKPKPTREKLSPEQKTVRKEITDKMKTQSQLYPIRRKKGQVEQENADLFDVVKGQLLDEGLNEEEIKDIMLTLTPDEILNELSGDLLRRAAVAAGDKAAKLASQKDTAGAVKKIKQQKEFSSAMKKKNLEKQARESNRKPTQYDSPLTKPMMDYTKPYPKSSD